MSRRHLGLLLAAASIVAIVAPAHATDIAQVSAASGDVKHWVQSAVSPTPSYCEWTAADGVAAFRATNADGTSNMGCPHAWVAHADGDSLSFNAEFPAIDSATVTSVSYQADLSCRVTLSKESVVVADRFVRGDLSTDEHSVILVYPNGVEKTLLAAGSGVIQGRAFVKPGTYEIRLRVQAWESGEGADVIGGYRGRVAVNWAENITVGTESVCWGAVKATYGP